MDAEEFNGTDQSFALEHPERLIKALKKIRAWHGLKQSVFSSKAGYAKVEQGILKSVKAPTLQSWCRDGYLATNGKGYFYEQMIYLLGLAGHIPPAPAPSDAELRQRMTKVVQDMEGLTFPAAIADTRMRFLAFNAGVRVVLSESFISEILTERMNGFKLLHEMKKRGILLNYEDAIVSTIERFKLVNLYRQHEEYFLAYPECMETVLEDDYPHFAAAWEAFGWEAIRLAATPFASPRQENLNPFVVQLRDKQRNRCMTDVRTQPIWGFGNAFVLASYVPVDNPSKETLETAIDEVVGRNPLKRSYLSWEGGDDRL